MSGLDLVKLVTPREPYSFDGGQRRLACRRWRREGAEASRRRDRLRREEEHPALPRRLRLQGHRGPRDDERRRHPRALAGRRLPLERPGRSGGRRLRRRDDQGLLGKKPIFGICLGHQLLALALGGKTYKLKFGHRGANQPVKDLATGRIEITTQNHGFCVDLASLPASVVSTHVHLNDGTSEGLAAKDLAAFSVQYHPEAAAGPHDSLYLFDRFTAAMEQR